MKKTMQFILDRPVKVTIKLEIVSGKIDRPTEDLTRLLVLAKRTNRKMAALARRIDRKLAS